MCNQNNQPLRIQYLDAARGVGILLVVLGHIVSMDTFLVRWIYGFHIPLFFILSGILAGSRPQSSRNLRAFVCKKAGSLLYPYLTFSILSLIFLRFSSSLDKFGANIPTALSGIGIGTLWFLPALFLAEIVFYIVHRQKPAARAVLALLILVFSTWFSGRFYFAVPDPDLLTGWSVVNVVNRGLIGFLWMEIGWLLAVLQERWKNTCSIGIGWNLIGSGWNHTGTGRNGIGRNKEAAEQVSGRAAKRRMGRLVAGAILLGISLALTVSASYTDLHYSLIGNPIRYYARGLSGSCAVILLCRMIPECVSSILSFWGRNSLVIFACHMNLGIVTAAEYMTTDTLRFEFSEAISFFVVLGVSSLLAFILNRFGKVLIQPKELQKMAKEKMALCYSITVVASAFLLAQYAKCILMNGMGKGIAMILLMIAALIPLIAAILLFRSSWRRGQEKTNEAKSSIDTEQRNLLTAAARALCIILGNAAWYVLLLKTIKLLWNTPPAVWGISFVFVVSAAVMYTGRRAIFL